MLDASFTFQWLFKDEALPESDAALGLVSAGGALVPALWFVEITNGLGMAERRRYLTQAGFQDALRLLRSLPLSVNEPASLAWSEPVLDLMRTHRLTAYDATYLELAVRHGLPLATHDQRAAQGCARRRRRVAGGGTVTDLALRDLAGGQPQPPTLALAATAVPMLVAALGDAAAWRCMEFFTAHIRNLNTRRAYACACARFLGWCEQRGLTLMDSIPTKTVRGLRDQALIAVPTYAFARMTWRLACRSKTCGRWAAAGSCGCRRRAANSTPCPATTRWPKRSTSMSGPPASAPTARACCSGPAAATTATRCPSCLTVTNPGEPRNVQTSPHQRRTYDVPVQAKKAST